MALQTVTLHFPTSQLPTIATRLTAHLLQRQYSFLQTFHSPTHTDFDIFMPQQPLVRLSLQSAATPEAASTPAVFATFPCLAADAVGIIHHLLQA